MEELKKQFIDKWSVWFMFEKEPPAVELKKVFAKELDEILGSKLEPQVSLPEAGKQVFTIEEVREICILFHNSIPKRRIMNERDYKNLLDEIVPIVKTSEP